VGGRSVVAKEVEQHVVVSTFMFPYFWRVSVITGNSVTHLDSFSIPILVRV
jgi:hypothetical protein